MQRTFTQTFRSLVAQQPDDIAILTDGEDKLSYAQLDARAQNVAAAIVKLPDGLIAIAIEKSADYIAALLGCWYAGKAFLPLDPALPQARLQWILQDARPVAILTRKSYSDLFTGTQPLLIEDLRDQAYSPQALHADACAYVIYTSGSTGNPKGVVVTHAGLTSVIEAQITAFDLKRGDRSLFYLSISFDASLSDIGTALLSGATLCIETKSKLELAADLSNVIAQRGITFMDIPPSLLRLLRLQVLCLLEYLEVRLGLLHLLYLQVPCHLFRPVSPRLGTPLMG
jgi:non-ribosomal peptide synthetase component F